MTDELPESLKRELDPRCGREISTRILRVVKSNPAVCIQEVAKAVNCSDITARKNLVRLVRVGLAVEKKIGKARVFVKTNELREVSVDDLL
jgi:predicted transcriptional regulator